MIEKLSKRIEQGFQDDNDRKYTTENSFENGFWMKEHESDYYFLSISLP